MANPKDWTPEDSRRRAAEELEAMRRQDAYRLAHPEFTKKAASQALPNAVAPQSESCGEAVPDTIETAGEQSP